MPIPMNACLIPTLLLLTLFGCSEESRLRMKAASGDPVAMRKLGGKLWEQGPTQEDANAGIELIRKAAEKGDLDAIYRMGSIFDSIEWYRKGAEAGHRICMIKP